MGQTAIHKNCNVHNSQTRFCALCAIHAYIIAKLGSLVKGPGLYSAIHRASQCCPVLLRGRVPFTTWAASKQKELELFSMEEVAVETAAGSVEGSRVNLAPEEELMDPAAAAPSTKELAAAAAQSQGRGGARGVGGKAE
eukprot:1146288-Pelagomonas_calceolata.AAC.6